jgi:hypothetical protein
VRSHRCRRAGTRLRQNGRPRARGYCDRDVYRVPTFQSSPLGGKSAPIPRFPGDFRAVSRKSRAVPTNRPYVPNGEDAVNRVDRDLLQFCRDDFRSLRELRGRISGGTLYRHAKKLVRLGWLLKEGPLYRATSMGLRQLDERPADSTWDGVEGLYPPLALVPSPVHRAVAELILAAVVARQHEVRPDRHPFFVCFGRTFKWKTSLGLFVCHALGLDPTRHVVDLGAESGKSLTVRRSGGGGLAFARELLGTEFVSLDEFLNADSSVRSSLGLFLAGRLSVPFENEQLAVKPVALLTLNPRDKPTLEGRIGLSAPLIRRAILADLDVVAMPDLATVGQQALTTAHAHAPLVIQPPAVDCVVHRERVVDVVRGILRPDAHERVDVELVLTLCTGMTAFRPDATQAIRQVLYDLGVVSETLQWTRPGWMDIVRQFDVRPAQKTDRQGGQRALPPAGTSPMPEDDNEIRSTDTAPAPVVLQPVPAPRRKRGLPELDLSAELHSRLIWLAVDTGQGVDDVLTLLLDFYLEWRQDDDTITTLANILALGKALGVAEVDPKTLQALLQAQASLAEHHCSFEDVPDALRVMTLLERLPVDWTWSDAEAAIGLVGELLTGEIPANEVSAFLVRHRRLHELGFAETAELLAVALVRAGAAGERREAMIAEIVAIAGESVDRERLTQERQALVPEVRRLADERDQLTAEVTALQHRRDELHAEWTAKRSQLDVLRALKTLLLCTPGAAQALLKDLASLSHWLRIGGRQDDVYGGPIVDHLRAKIIDFVQQLVDEAKS